jgi:hypothetical protein
MHHYRQIKYMLTVREHMGSHPGVGGVRISHLCRFLSRACVCEYVCVCVGVCVGEGKGLSSSCFHCCQFLCLLI